MGVSVVINPFTGEPQLINSGGGGGGSSNSFATIQPPSGTSPTAASATDTLNLTSSDSSVGMTGNATTKTVDVILSPTVSKAVAFTNAPVSGTPANPHVINTGDPNTIGLQIKGNTNSLHPSGIVFYAGFNHASLNAVYGPGTLTVASSAGSPALSGSTVDLTGFSKWIGYDPTGGNFNTAYASGVFSIAFDVIPAFTGSPASQVTFFSCSHGGSTTNMLQLYVDTAGTVKLYFFNSSAGVIGIGNLGSWSPTSGTQYNFELCVDMGAGNLYLFLNGTLLGSLTGLTGTTSSNQDTWRFGQDYSGGNTGMNCKLTNIATYSTCRHTSNFSWSPSFSYEGVVQTADLLEILDPTGTTLMKVDSGGNVTAQSFVGPVTGNVTGTATNVTGVVAAANGGSGQSSFTAGDILYATGSTTLAKLPIGSQDQMLSVNASGLPYYRDQEDPSTFTDLLDDFSSGSNTGDTGWLPVVSGTGAAAVNTVTSPATNPGIETLTTGTLATNFATIRRSLTSFVLGGGRFQYEWMGRIPVLSNATDTFKVRVGLCDANSTEANNGVYFAYDPSATFAFNANTHTSTAVDTITGASGVFDINSIQVGMAVTGSGIPANTTVTAVNYAGNSLTLSAAATSSLTATALTFTVGNFWIAKSANGGTRTVMVTNSAVAANTFYKLACVINAAGTSAVFTVGASTVATITTNIPTANACTPVINITKTVGTTALTLDIDYWKHRQVFTTAR